MWKEEQKDILMILNLRFGFTVQHCTQFLESTLKTPDLVCWENYQTFVTKERNYFAQFRVQQLYCVRHVTSNPVYNFYNLNVKRPT